MKYQKNDRLYGFTVTRVREVPELSGTFYELRHDGGAELCWLQNGEENKLFSVAFKTLPQDSTGVFHILEHAMLCGSEKYPVREPFLDLLKGSMNTFLNAFTYPDKTVYPCSSRNTKDFLNLTAVYLDAVFSPKLLSDPNIFYQEGWHIEPTENGYAFNGIVFNEMKGALANQDSIVGEEMLHLLFPDTCYGVISGGDPLVIPTLTYEEFCATYRRFYHPCNARFYLDGDLPFEETLALIDGYLTKPGDTPAIPEIAMQTPRAAVGHNTYEIGEDEPRENRGQVTFGKIVGTYKDRRKVLALRVLFDAVAGSNESPLTRALLSAGLAENLEVEVADYIAQPYVQVNVKNVKDGKADEALALLRDTAKTLCETGIDKDELAAALAALDYQLHDIAEPQGIERNVNALCTWLYGDDPLALLVPDGDLAAVKEMIAGDGFETLLCEIFCDEQNVATLYTEPSLTLGEENRRKEAALCAQMTAAWGEPEKAANKALCDALLLWQQTPDTPEQIATLPMLSLSEAGEPPAWVATEESVQDGVRVWAHTLPCRDVTHLKLYFPLTDCDLETLGDFELFTHLLCELPTAQYSARLLQQKIKRYFGYLHFAVSPVQTGDTATCVPCLVAVAGCMRQNVEKALELLTEILLHTDTTDPAPAFEILRQVDATARQSEVAEGHQFALFAAGAGGSAAGAVSEALHGHTQVTRLHHMMEREQETVPAFLKAMTAVFRAAVGKAGLLVSVTADERPDLSPLFAALPDGGFAFAPRTYTTAVAPHTTVQIPAAVGFAAQSLTLPQAKHNGALKVAGNILSFDYLWNKIRVQGGAYGTGFGARPTGQLFAYSFRDPSPVQSLAVFKTLATALSEFCDSGEDVTRYILSTVSALEPLQTPKQKGATADAYRFEGLSQADVLARRNAVLATDREAIRACASLLQTFAEQGSTCIVAGTELLPETDKPNG